MPAVVSRFPLWRFVGSFAVAFAAGRTGLKTLPLGLSLDDAQAGGQSGHAWTAERD